MATETNSMDSKESIAIFTEFFENNCIDKIASTNSVLEVGFDSLSKWNIDLANELLANPEDTIKAAEIALKSIDITEDKELSVWFVGLPKSQQKNIWQVRKNDIGGMLGLRGIINKISPITPICKSARFECPVCGSVINVLQQDSMFKEPNKCLPKGTKVWTSNGLMPIEEANKVLCMDYEGDLIESKAKIIHTGRQEIWRINDEIECSSDHLWFVLRNGKCRFLPTKDLNTGDVLYRIYGKNMHNLQKNVSSRPLIKKKKRQGRVQGSAFGETNMFSRMQVKTSSSLSAGKRKNKDGRGEDYNIISTRPILHQRYCQSDANKQESCISKIEAQGNHFKRFSNTTENRYKARKNNFSDWRGKSQLQAWKEMWGEILQEHNEKIWIKQMPFLWNKENINSPSQGFKSFESSHIQPNDSLQFVPYEVSRIVKVHKQVEMYDLQVLDYNNFILENGVVSHNCSCGRKGRMTLLHKEMEDTIKLGLIDDLMEEDNADRSIAREKLSILSGVNLTSQDIDRRLKPGKKVIINGYFKYTQKANSKEFDLVFQANSIEFVEVGWDTVKVNKTEERQIKELAKQDNIIERLSGSIADVEGFKEVKEACLLLLAGAPHMHDKNGHLVSRGTIHVLLIGNPGTGKSFLAKRAGAISPLHYFQSAATASGKGLVASVVKDPDIDGYAVYPGVVVMASKGVATIDEIDKTNKDDYGDHNNAMNECEVTIAKANIKARLEADTSYLATANPEHRVFTAFEPYHEQIAMPKDFQDRFDIIFPMMPSDKAEERDRIMDIMLERHIGDEEQKKWNPEFTHEFIRKYIAYCRRANPKPKVSRELFKTIKKRLSELMRPKDEEQVKVSYRHLESIMRFAYASARLRLRDITESDIDLAFSLKFASFKELGIIDISGTYNWSVEEGVQEEKISDDKVIHDVLKEMLPDKENLAEIQEIVNACIKKGIDEEKVDEYIEKKKMIGDYIEARRGFLKRE